MATPQSARAAGTPTPGDLDAAAASGAAVSCSASGCGLPAAGRAWGGVEAEVSTAVSAAIAGGHAVRVSVGDTLADGMAGNIEPGSVTVGLVAHHVDELVTVTEAGIRRRSGTWRGERCYLAEGSGAVRVAALRAGKVVRHGRPVAVDSGRSIALPTLAAVLDGT